MSSASVILIDCPPQSPAPMSRIAGMYLAERLAKEQLREGAQVYIRSSRQDFENLDVSEANYIELEAPVPKGATLISATHLLGIEISDQKSKQRAQWALLQTCRRPYDGPADKYLLRSFSLRITKVLSGRSVSPNTVTAFSTLLGLFSCFLLAVYGMQRWSLALAGVSILSAVILDSVDGELARICHKGSKLGMWLDNLSDDTIDTSLLFCMGMAIGGHWFTISVVAAIARAFAALITYRGAALLGQPGDVMAFRWWFESEQETEVVYENPLAPLTLLRSFGRRDMYITVFAISFVAGVPLIALLLGIGNAVSHFALAILHLLLHKKPERTISS